MDQGHEGQWDNVTYLFIRTHPLDNGDEPLTPGLPAWISPDIVVIKPDGTPGDQAVANEENSVQVTVNNRGGVEAKDAFVEAFVADPSTAFTLATATLVGSGFLTIPGYGSAQISLPWKPGPADAGHRCLLARVALFMPPDAYADGSIFDVYGDRHVAQRNIQVIEMQQQAQTFSFSIVNPVDNEGRFAVKVSELDAMKHAETLRALLGPKLEIQPARERLATIDIRVTGLPAEGPKTSRPERTPGPARRPPILERKVIPVTSLTLSMRRGEVTPATVTVVRSPSDSGVHVLQVEQIDLQTQKQVGGIWWVLRSQ